MPLGFWAARAKEKEMHKTLDRIRENLSDNEQGNLAGFGGEEAEGDEEG